MRHLQLIASFCLLLFACNTPRAEETPATPPAAPSSQEAPTLDWQARFAALAAAAEERESTVVPGEQGWLFFAPELRHLSLGPFWGEAASRVSRAPAADADPLPAILDFQRQLDEAGVDLLFVPVPAKAAVYPDALPNDAAGAAGVDIARADTTFLDQLREAGVAVLDLLPLFRQRAGDAGDEHPLYCRQDTHWSGRGCQIAAEAIAEEIGERPWRAAAAQEDLATETRQVQIEGDLWRVLPAPRPPQESLTLRFVGRQEGGALTPLPPSRQSPVLLLGDSHALVFHAGGDLHAQGAGLADQLAYAFGFALDVIGVRGSGATPARLNLLRRGDGLAGKKLVIWCLSVREYTEGQGWKKVPIRP